MNTKKIIRQIHLWLGILSGLVLSILGITGSIYVLEPEVAAYLEKERYITEKPNSLFHDDIQIAQYVEEQAGKKIESIQWPKRGRETYVFKFFEDDHWYYLDQSTGKITDNGTGIGNKVFNFILELHTTLTLGKTGKIITGTASLLFALLMLTTGLYLWWPRSKARRKISFAVKWAAKPKRLNYDLHNINGFYFFLPLFLMGITGASFYYGEEVQWVLDKMTFSEPAPKRVYKLEADRVDKEMPFLTIEQALAKMNEHYPHYYKRNMWMTDQPDGTLSFAYQKYIHVHTGPDTRIFLRANPYTGQILSERNPDKMPLGSAIKTKWLLKVHFGEFGGILTRILWFVAGLMPALLTYTGVKIWLGRTKKKDLRGKTTARPSAQRTRRVRPSRLRAKVPSSL